MTRCKRSGRSIWKMKHVLNILAFNTCFNGSDVDENRHFIQGEVVAHRQILFLISIYEWKSYSKMKNLPNLLSFGTEGLPYFFFFARIALERVSSGKARGKTALPSILPFLRAHWNATRKRTKENKEKKNS